MNKELLLFHKILRKNDLSVTNARKTVFLQLLGKEPQTMHELELAIGKKVNRTSIYRATEVFNRLGLVRKLQIGWKYKIELSDIFVEHHHHISCLGCGRVIVIHEDKKIEDLIREIATAHNVNRAVHQLEIQGYCQDCSLKKS